MALQIQVANKGAELISIKFNNKEMLHDGKKFWDRQAPILFPMVGRLRDNKTIINGKEYEIPQHGFAKDMEFNLIEENKNKKIYMTKSNNETLKMYPFKFELYITYKIENNKLEIEYRVVNIDKQDMIFGIGGHPGFKLELNQDQYYFELDSIEDNIEFMEVEGQYISNSIAKNLLKDNRFINIEKDSFINDAIMIKKFKSKKIALKQKRDNKKILEMDISDFPILGIWSLPEANYICLEPWFNTADKVIESSQFKDKEGIITLKANEKFICKYVIEFFD